MTFFDTNKNCLLKVFTFLCTVIYTVKIMDRLYLNS